MTEDASEAGHGPLCPPILFLPSLPCQRRIMCWAQPLALCSYFFNLTYCYFSPPNIYIHTWINFKGKMYVGKLSPSKECFLPAWHCSSIQQFTACNTDPVLRKWDSGLLQKHAHMHTYTHTWIMHMHIYTYMRAYTAMYIYACMQVHVLTNIREYKVVLSSLTAQTLPRRSLSKMSVHWYRES